jgi:hypothetical protein
MASGLMLPEPGGKVFCLVLEDLGWKVGDVDIYLWNRVFSCECRRPFQSTPKIYLLLQLVNH